MSTPQTSVPLDAPAGAVGLSESSVATSRRRVRPALRSVVLGVAATAAATTLSFALMPTTAAAMPTVVQVDALPTNAMATEVTSSARIALESFDRWSATGDGFHERAFIWFRAQTAHHAATELGYPTDEMISAWAAAPIGHQLAVLAAMTQVGVPYRYGSSSEGVGFDCSGITQFAWARAGVALVHQSSGQINAAAPIDRASAKAGDLVQYPGHVMMYLGIGDAIIHSVQTGRTVELDTINARRSSSVRFGDPTV
jgi:cell wall-associated NlpC family hydrolase